MASQQSWISEYSRGLVQEKGGNEQFVLAIQDGHQDLAGGTGRLGVGSDQHAGV